MQTYKKFLIKKEDILPTAERMKTALYPLMMIHGHVDKEGQNVISYDYEVGDCLESYSVSGEKELPSLGGIYDSAAIWPEREIIELMDIKFSGMDNTERLFLADNMLDGQGHIIVTPLSELRDKNVSGTLTAMQKSRGGTV